MLVAYSIWRDNSPAPASSPASMKVRYRYSGWVRMYNEKVGMGVFTEVYVKVGMETF
jgi:hypothetical protein